jgi:uncharacterized protein
VHHGEEPVPEARVRDGEIVEYDDYMDPIAMAALLGRTQDLVAALTAA